MANLTKCMVCGNKYSYCPTCAGTHAWKFYTDTHEHYQIYMILEQYNSKTYTKEDARVAFGNIGIDTNTDLSNLKEGVANQIRDIVTESEPTTFKKSKKGKIFED